VRLGLLLDDVDPARGGAEAYAGALLARAAARGFRPLVARLRGDPPPGVVAVDVGRVPRSRPARDRAFARQGEAALRAAGADVVLAFRHAPRCDVYFPHGGLVEDAWRAAAAARGGEGRLRRIASALSRKRGFFREAEHAVLGGERGPRVIALSRALAGRIASRFPGARARTTVVPNGVDSDRFDPQAFAAGRAATRRALGVPEDAYVGLHVSHNPRLKGLETALRAGAEARLREAAPEFRLVVVGPPDRSLARLARRLGVAGRVVATGPVRDVRPLYAASDVLVHPTWHDPCSLVCLEAASMAVPVVTTPADGFSELLGRRGGIVVERPGDPEAVATALAVLADPRLRAETADDARYLARTNRLETRLDQALDVCREAAAGERP
jgi:UDP-glucose:(heptosyl)LPS alpha-1,3-glucosyltransferase